MLKTIYCCDRCGEEITGDIYDIGFGIYNNLNEVEDWDGNNFNLCEKCVTDILCSIDGYKENPFRKHFSTHNDKEIVFIDDLPKYQEGQDVELPFGVKKEYKKTYNLADLLAERSKPSKSEEHNLKAKQETTELSKAVSNLNSKLTEFSKVAALTPSNKSVAESSIGRTLADKLIKNISDVSFGEILLPGALDRRLEAIEKSLTPQEINYLRKLDADGELTNFFGQVFEDAIKKA